MADELLITGQTGLKNVSAEAVRELLSGLAGTGQYVLKGFTCTLNGTTAVNVAGGVALFNGAEVYLKKTGQSVAISAGASGTNRRDLIVLRFTRTSQQDTNKESCSLVYLKGTAASSPKDPTYNTGSILDGIATVDMPIARITWTGVTPTIANIANKLQSADDYRDSISQVVTVGDDKVTFLKRSGVVTCSGQVGKAITAWNTVKLCDIPSGFEPIVEVFGSAICNSTDGAKIIARPDKTLSAMALIQNIPGNYDIVFCLSWVTAN